MTTHTPTAAHTTHLDKEKGKRREGENSAKG
jgi:hypothetical protein